MVRSLARFLSKLARPAVRRLARCAAIARTADVLAACDEPVLFAFFPICDDWRRSVTTHMRVAGTLGEGDHYPWKLYVNQVTGERTIPPSR